MDRLSAMRVFARVARLESFAGAARELRLSVSVVSRRVAELEESLGVRLLERTTRRVSLTEVGAAYLDRCERILTDVDELDDAVSGLHAAPRGRLRITAGVTFGEERLVPVLTDFLERYPEVELEAVFTDRHVSLVEEGFDLAVRVTRLADSSDVVRRLGGFHVECCAAPGYLERHGRPAAPADLAHHECILDTNNPSPDRWTFVPRGGGDEIAVRVTGRLTMAGATAVRNAALRGFGIAMLPSFVARRALEDGTLESLFPDHHGPELGLYAVYPPGRHLAARVRALIDHLAERFGGGGAPA